MTGLGVLLVNKNRLFDSDVSLRTCFKSHIYYAHEGVWGRKLIHIAFIVVKIHTSVSSRACPQTQDTVFILYATSRILLRATSSNRPFVRCVPVFCGISWYCRPSLSCVLLIWLTVVMDLGHSSVVAAPGG